VARGRDGDPDKLGLLYERYKRPLLGFFIGMVHDRELVISKLGCFIPLK
jgi:hypothetical protein